MSIPTLIPTTDVWACTGFCQYYVSIHRTRCGEVSVGPYTIRNSDGTVGKPVELCADHLSDVQRHINNAAQAKARIAQKVKS